MADENQTQDQTPPSNDSVDNQDSVGDSKDIVTRVDLAEFEKSVKSTVESVMAEYAKKHDGRYKKVVEDVVKLRRHVKGKDAPEDDEKEKPGKGSDSELPQEHLDRIDALERKLAESEKKNSYHRLYQEVTEKAKDKIEPEYIDLVTAYLKKEFDSGGTDEFSPDEFLKVLLEKHPGMRRKQVTPPLVKGRGTHKIDYEKIKGAPVHSEDRRRALSEGLDNLS